VTISGRRKAAKTRAARCGGLAVALGVGVAAVTGHGVAWADTTGGDSAGGSVSHSDSATHTGAPAGPKNSPESEGHVTHRAQSPSSASGSDAAKANPSHTDTADGPRDATPTTTRTSAESTPRPGPANPSASGDDATSSAATKSTSMTTPAVESDSAAPQQIPPTTDAASLPPTSTAPTATVAPSIPTVAEHAEAAAETPSDTSPTVATKPSARAAPRPLSLVGESETARPESSVRTTLDESLTATHTALASSASPTSTPTVSTATVTTTPSAPAAVSPIAAILSLPGRIVNGLLGLLGITTSAGTAPSPINPSPIADLFFAVFRRLEGIVGLDAPLTGQPVPPSETFTGSLTTPTPTVAQFLNAAAAEYVLGGTPGGLTPLTVNGWPMTSTNEFTGESAQAWVTPQNQIIIAYQGTTGGTNLLFNPLIAVAQVVTDAIGILTNTTPAAFPQALQFAQQVQAEAALQSYAPSDIFVTGHSLGGWEAEYVAQNTGMGGIGFESLGLPTTVLGNGANSLFVNTAAYGDPAAYLASDLSGLQPFEEPYVAGGGLNPHYGPIVLLGDPSAQTPLTNAAALWGTSILGDLVFAVDFLGNLFEYHLPGNQAYNLDVDPDPGVVPWLGVDNGPIHTGFGAMTIPEFLQAASVAGILIAP
jgi:hypothetical protein